MSDVRVAHRYASALIGVSDEMKNLDIIFRDFEFIDKMIREVRELALFLKNPILKTEKKKQVLQELLRSRISDITMKFILLLTVKNREGLLPEIIHEFYRLRDEKLGILNVSVRTAVKFSASQEDHLVRQVSTATKKKVRMKYILDASLKGGFTVQFEDTVWDASVRHQLELLRLKFMEGVS